MLKRARRDFTAFENDIMKKNLKPLINNKNIALKQSTITELVNSSKDLGFKKLFLELGWVKFKTKVQTERKKNTKIP